MVDELQLFRQSSLGIDYIINDNIIVHHPTLSEITDFGEQKYYSMATALTCNPSAYKLALFDMGIDFDTLGDFDFFIMMCASLSKDSTKLLLGELDLSALKPGRNNQTEEVVLCAEVDGQPEVVVDRALYCQLSDYLRRIHGFEKKVDKPADQHTKMYLIERERKRIARHKKDKPKSMLKPLISSMVNQAGFKYDYVTVWDLPISVFNDSVTRIQKFLHYTQTMAGAYAGTIDLKQVNTEALNWLN